MGAGEDLDQLWTTLLARVRAQSADFADLLKRRAALRLDTEFGREVVYAMPKTDYVWLQRNPVMERLLRDATEELLDTTRVLFEVRPEDDHRELSPSAYALLSAVGDLDAEPLPFATPPKGVSPFERIKTVEADGRERWSSRALARVLGYKDYRSFLDVIKKAEIACISAGGDPTHHFGEFTELIGQHGGTRRFVKSVQLTRFACYLVAMNGDRKKRVIAQAQAYFAVQTRRQELAGRLREDLLRVQLREELKEQQKHLFEAAHDAGVLTARDFALFQDAGYEGLYNGLKAADIHRRKGLAEQEHILDRMGSVELAANFFRVTQTEEKLEREHVHDKRAANRVHHDVGEAVRKTIEGIGGRMPESMETPDPLEEARKRLADSDTGGA